MPKLNQRETELLNEIARLRRNQEREETKESAAGTAGGATTFLGLNDTPGAYTGSAGAFLRVGAGTASVIFGTVDYTDLYNVPTAGTSTLGVAAFSNANFIVTGGTVSIGTVDYSVLTSIPSTFAPSTHAASHQDGGGDEIATATPGANAIIKADADGKIGAGWIDDADINLDNVTEGTTNKFFTATDETKLGTIEDNADVTDAGNVGAAIHGATEKVTIHDDDEFGGINTEASNVLTWWKWSTIKATLVATFLTFTNKIAIAATATSGAALRVIRDLGSGSTDTAVFELIQENAGDDQAAMYVRQDGTGAVIVGYDGATKVFELSDGGTLSVYSVIKALTASGIQFQDDGGNLGMTVVDGGEVVINGTAGLGGNVHYTLQDTGAGPQYVINTTGNWAGLSMRRKVGSGDEQNWQFLSGAGGVTQHFCFEDVTGGLTASASPLILQGGGTGKVSIGAGYSPQGKLHVHDGIGGSLFVTKTGIDGTAQTIIPNGTGDVVRGATINGVYYNSNGDFGHANFAGLANGSSYTIDIGGGGTQVLTIAIAASGELTVQRTAGSYTWSIAIHIVWL